MHVHPHTHTCTYTYTYTPTIHMHTHVNIHVPEQSHTHSTYTPLHCILCLFLSPPLPYTPNHSRTVFLLLPHTSTCVVTSFLLSTEFVKYFHLTSISTLQNYSHSFVVRRTVAWTTNVVFSIKNWSFQTS